MITTEEVRKALSDHDDRFAAGAAEIRMLGSLDADGEPDFVIFVVMVKGLVPQLFNEFDEDAAIQYFIDHTIGEYENGYANDADSGDN